ncbi:unnamed protein product [Kluyveromyces dobzhanskii CBS 2104]|uniref:WGS project CCBQ000000000 data, contig 00058 n=1 Tax=Kluyveromyces dobzhanskii CBS 2104 TaxID=1427455 RepID=A0A0A8LBP6_9SACH|nr:unnamed protein product [Kluyveromyces dobzhanskii CBS 2104]
MTSTRQNNLVLPPISTILPLQYFNGDTAAQPSSPPVPAYYNASVPHVNFSQLNTPEQYSNSCQRYTTTSARHTSISGSSSDHSSNGSANIYAFGNSLSSDAVPMISQLRPRAGSSVATGLAFEMNGIASGNVNSITAPSSQMSSQIYHQPTIANPGLCPAAPVAAINNQTTSHSVGPTHPIALQPQNYHNSTHSITQVEPTKNLVQAQRHHNNSSPTIKSKAVGKAHICEQCGKQFTRPSALRTHMLVHSGDKPFECSRNGCTKKFNVKSNLIRHLKLHK